ncbi:MAG: enoyl-CoA hydratase/isomerase family protein [Cupriavidus necator]
MRKALDALGAFQKTVREGKQIISSLLDCEKPVIAKLNGHAMGLGATIALFCDMIYAAENAKIGDPHIRVGLVAGDGGAVIWPQLIGYARAKEFLMTGNVLTATEAARIGLINHAIPAAELDDCVREISDRLAAGPTKAIRWTKVSANIGLKHWRIRSWIPRCPTNGCRACRTIIATPSTRSVRSARVYFPARNE